MFTSSSYSTDDAEHVVYVPPVSVVVQDRNWYLSVEDEIGMIRAVCSDEFVPRRRYASCLELLANLLQYILRSFASKETNAI